MELAVEFLKMKSRSVSRHKKCQNHIYPRRCCDVVNVCQR